MEFCLLGSLIVRSGGVALPVQRGKQRAVLAALLLDANRVVSLDELAETLWGPAPPPSARVTVQNYVMRLRKALGDAGGARIRTHQRGYLISVDAGELDVAEFEAFVNAARAAARDGSWDTVAAQARRALELWRGEPLADVESEALATREVPRLAELRLQALDQRIAADLHLGRHHEVIAELRQLVGGHPLREHLHAQLMLALYRAGRQAEALAAYQHARQVLIEELGTEPGGELRGLHQRMLTADPALAAPEPASPAADDTASAVPRELSAGVRDFTGRAAELAALTELLDRPGEETPGMVVIGGAAGVGKTTLAVHWAHQVAARFPDGQLCIDLRGYAPQGPMDPAEALARFLRALGVPGKQVPGDVAESAAMFRSLLAAKRIMLLLDNAADADQVRPLLPGDPGCLVVVTSRDRLAGLSVTHGAMRMSVDVLPAVESEQLLTRLLGEDRVRAEAGAVPELARLCAHLPLALRIAAANLADRPSASIASYAAELRTSERLTVLQVPDDPACAVRATLRTSFARVAPAALRMFRLFSVHPGPDVSRSAMASLVGQPLAEAGVTVDALIRAHLLTEHTPGRLSWHDLLRLCADELAVSDETVASRETAARRMLDHYLRSACLADRLLDPSRTPINLAPPQPGTSPESVESLTSKEQALAWFEAERLALIAIVSQAAAAGRSAYAWQIAWSMVSFLERRGYWHDMVRTQRTGLAAVERLGDLNGAARMHRSLASALVFIGALDEAEAHLRQSLGIACRLGDPTLQGDAHLNLGWVLSEALDYQNAVTHASAALERFRVARHRGSAARALNNLGWYQLHLGRYELAAEYCEQALGIIRAAGDRYSEAQVRDSLGCIYLRLKRHADALDCLQAALDTYCVLGDRYMEAIVLSHLGDVHSDARRLCAADDAWRRSLAIFEDLDHPEAGQVREKLLAPRPGLDRGCLPRPVRCQKSAWPVSCGFRTSCSS
jgi:DNA-binding SARP family transcriptional activator/Tfp pilus assembly protein PilF